MQCSTWNNGDVIQGLTWLCSCDTNCKWFAIQSDDAPRVEAKGRDEHGRMDQGAWGWNLYRLAMGTRDPQANRHHVDSPPPSRTPRSPRPPRRKTSTIARGSLPATNATHCAQASSPPTCKVVPQLYSPRVPRRVRILGMPCRVPADGCARVAGGSTAPRTHAQEQAQAPRSARLGTDFGHPGVTRMRYGIDACATASLQRPDPPSPADPHPFIQPRSLTQKSKTGSLAGWL